MTILKTRLDFLKVGEVKKKIKNCDAEKGISKERMSYEDNVNSYESYFLNSQIINDKKARLTLKKICKDFLGFRREHWLSCH